MLFGPEQDAEFRDALAKMKKPADVEWPLGFLAARLGFDQFVFGVRLPVAGREPMQMIYTSMPSEWNRIYDTRRFMDHDPMILRSQETTRPFSHLECDWSHPRAQELLTEGAKWGFCHALITPLQGPGIKVGTMILPRRDPPIPASGPERRELDMAAQYYSGLIFARFLEIATPGLFDGLSLTGSEAEALRLSALGRQRKEIAYALQMTRGTVDRVLAKILLKTKSKTIKEAIQRAIANQQIRVVEYPMTMNSSDEFVESQSEPLIMMRRGGESFPVEITTADMRLAEETPTTNPHYNATGQKRPKKQQLGA